MWLLLESKIYGTPSQHVIKDALLQIGVGSKKHKYCRQKFLSNAYFCIRNMDCLQKIVPGAKHKHLYMGNYYFQSLTQEHVDLLKQYGYWDNIINNRKQLTDDATSKDTGNGNQE